MFFYDGAGSTDPAASPVGVNASTYYALKGPGPCSDGANGLLIEAETPALAQTAFTVVGLIMKESAGRPSRITWTCYNDISQIESDGAACAARVRTIDMKFRKKVRSCPGDPAFNHCIRIEEPGHEWTAYYSEFPEVQVHRVHFMWGPTTLEELDRF